jgi:rhodanese-related sulfurtransferase
MHRQNLLFVSLMAVSTLTLAAPDWTAAEAAKATAEGKAVLIDIRTPPEWRETGYAKGAKLINLQQTDAGFKSQVLAAANGDKNTPIALICRTGNRTTFAQKSLQEAGFTKVYNVKEGMVGSAAGPGYMKQGLPLSTCKAEC